VKGERGFSGDGVDRRDAWLFYVEDLTFGPDGLAYIPDWNNHRVRRVNADDTIDTIIGTDYEGDGPEGEIDRLPVGNPQGAPGLEVALNHPTDLEFLSDGTLVLAAWHNNKIRVWDPDTSIVTVMAGNDYGYAGDDLPAYEAAFNQPKSVAIDENDQIYLNDQRNQRIRLIDNGEPRMIRTIAGTGVKGYAGDGGLAIDAQFGFDGSTTPLPSGSLVLHDGFLFIADSLNHRIRRINLGDGTIECIAGNGELGYAGDGGEALEASFNQPLDIELGPDGRLYVADTFNNVIRAIDLDTGIIESVAGNGLPCTNPINCFEEKEGLPALEIQLSAPYGIAFDPEGNLFIADTNNSRIVEIKN
jgi:DNA-binding beta-propeller fold protein YncE